MRPIGHVQQTSGGPGGAGTLGKRKRPHQAQWYNRGMSIEQAVVERMKSLPPDKQQEVLDFVEFLQQKSGGAARPPRKSLLGALAHLNVKVTEQDISDARREMWG